MVALDRIENASDLMSETAQFIEELRRNGHIRLKFACQVGGAFQHVCPFTNFKFYFKVGGSKMLLVGANHFNLIALLLQLAG